MQKVVDPGGSGKGVRLRQRHICIWADRLRVKAAAAFAGEPLFAGYRGSRSDLVRGAAARVASGLLLIFLGTRAFHLVQAAIDLSLGRAAYTRLVVALCLCAACFVESAGLAVVSIRCQRLTLSVVVADACFGVAGLAAMSVATSQAPGRTASLNWMLPYTVAPAVGVAIAVVFGGPPGGKDWRIGRRLVIAVIAVAVLATSFVASVCLPHRLADDSVGQIVGDTANYPAFFLVAMAFTLLLRSGVKVVARRNETAKRDAAELAEAAQWRAVTVDVFGPVLALLDDVRSLHTDVPDSVRAQAARLIELIEAVNPLSGDSRQLGVW